MSLSDSPSAPTRVSRSLPGASKTVRCCTPDARYLGRDDIIEVIRPMVSRLGPGEAQAGRLRPCRRWLTSRVNGRRSLSVRFRSLLHLLVSLTMSLTAAMSFAADVKTEAKSHYRHGVAEYNLGHFEEAIPEFEKAYQLDPAPVLLFNIAQSHFKIGNHERAIFFYRRYLDSEPTAKERVEIEERVRKLEAEPREPPKLPAAPAERKPPEPVGPALPLPPAPVALGLLARPSTSPTAGHKLRIAGLVSGGIGTAAIVTGAVFGLKARSRSDEVSGSKRFDPDADSSGRTAQTLQWVLYGTGAAALLSGAALLYRGWDVQRRNPLALVPALLPGGIGATARGVF